MIVANMTEFSDVSCIWERPMVMRIALTFSNVCKYLNNVVSFRFPTSIAFNV